MLYCFLINDMMRGSVLYLQKGACEAMEEDPSMGKKADEKQIIPAFFGEGSSPRRTASLKAKGPGKRHALILIVIWLLQWLLWGVWQTFALPRLPIGIGATLLNSVAVKGIVWAALLIPILQRFEKKLRLSLEPLFCRPFPWFACTVLLCLTTAFLYTVRLLRGLVNTHAVFDPMFIVLSVSAGVIEEFSFRGVLFRLQNAMIGFWPAALLNGALFTLLHYPGILFGASLMQLISWRALLIFVMGVVFCWMTRKWRNLALNMTVHTVWDILTYLFCLAG